MGKPVTVGDLPDLLGMTISPFLYCEICGGQYSANAGDYWDRPKDQVMACCGEPMRLVVKQVKFVDWERPDESTKTVRD
jgi:hypothetical protein